MHYPANGLWEFWHLQGFQLEQVTAGLSLAYKSYYRSLFSLGAGSRVRVLPRGPLWGSRLWKIVIEPLHLSARGEGCSFNIYQIILAD